MRLKEDESKINNKTLEDINKNKQLWHNWGMLTAKKSCNDPENRIIKSEEAFTVV